MHSAQLVDNLAHAAFLALIGAGLATAAETQIKITSDVGAPIGICALGATLNRPDNAKAIVVFVAGSGTHDRDERVGTLAPFHDIAEALAQRGIASLRYDKRGFQKECRSELLIQAIRPEHYLRDIEAVYAEARLRAPDLPTFVLAHSEGVTYSLELAAARRIDPCGLVLVAGMGHDPIDEIMLRQFRQVLPELSGDERQFMEDQILDAQAFFRRVRAGEASAAEYWPTDQRWASMGRVYVPFWSEEIAMTDRAAAMAAQAGKPSLLVQGDRDTNVTKNDFDDLAKALEPAGGKSVYLEGVDHFLTKPDEFKISPHVLELIADWVERTASLEQQRRVAIDHRLAGLLKEPAFP